MPEERLGLKEAGRLLSLSPNGVRARAAAGKIRYEIDNNRKWWVFLDPTAVANDSSKLRVPKALSVTSIATSKPFDFEPERRVFEAHIETLKGDVCTLTAALADAHRRLDLSEDERRKLVAALLEKQAAPPPQIAPEPPKRPWWHLFRGK
jgi:hypothetical protein